MDNPSLKRKNINRGVNLEDQNSRFISPDLKKSIFNRDNHQCVNCRSSDYLEVDHAIPVSMGGSADINNLQILCRKCNSKKRDRQWWGYSLQHIAIEKLGNIENLKLLYERTGIDRVMKI